MINPDDVRGARSQSSGYRSWAAPEIEDRLTPRNWQSFEHGVPITPLILGLIFREQVHQLILTASVPRSQTWRMAAPGPSRHFAAAQHSVAFGAKRTFGGSCPW